MTTQSLPARLSLRRGLLLLLAAGLFAIGWTAGIVARAVVWCATAVAVGWRDAMKAG